MKKNEIFNYLKEVISILSTIFYIILVAVLHFTDNTKNFLIPLILYAANFFMLIEALVIYLRDPSIKRRNIYWIIMQLAVNIIGIALSFWAYKGN